MAQVTGGEVLARMLKQEGVEVVFGIIDGTYTAFYANLVKLGIRLVSPRHETCAAHKAGAYARLTGRLGVCMASNGPGVANILPGIAVEEAEGNRVLVITSTRRVGIGYPDRGGAYQYFNQVGVIGNMSKWSCAVPAFERIPEIVRKALRKSFSGRPGVVHIDIPESIVNGQMDVDVPYWEPAQYRRVDKLAPSAEQVRHCADLLIRAQAPMIHAGSGVVHARAFAALKLVAEALWAPVTTSWGARGALPETSELAIPMPFFDINNQVRKDADAVLVLGSRLGETDWWGKAPNWRAPLSQTCIQVDADDEWLGTNKPMTRGILADVGCFLELLALELASRQGEINLDARRARVAGYAQAGQQVRAVLDQALLDPSVPMHTAHIADACARAFPADAIAVLDGGNAALWASFYGAPATPGSRVGTPKMGMLGAGLSQVLGAAIACPERQVYGIIGDGAMAFHSQEIETAVRCGLKVVYLVVCDRQWGMVKLSQQFALNPSKIRPMQGFDPADTINTDLGEIAWDQVAIAMGAHGERVADPALLAGALARARAADRCAVIHVDVDPVKHMWAPGLAQFKEMHQEPGGSVLQQSGC